METRKITFDKMHGLGNDYFYVNIDENKIEDLAKFANIYADRRTGIGGDGLITYNREPNGNFRMRIFNADGSEGLMCGNAIRCVAKLLYESGKDTRNVMAIETASGTKILHLTVADGEVTGVRVDMGIPVVIADDLAVDSTTNHTVKGIHLTVGNPHFVSFIEGKVGEFALEEIGPTVEHHGHFHPDRVNFEIAEVVSPHLINMRVWERGSGITMACGTGACATAVAAIHSGRAESPVTVVMPGGELKIEWSGKTDEPVFMTGPATYVYNGGVSTI